jgi:FAD/FMN-containing dehydrogenase
MKSVSSWGRLSSAPHQIFTITAEEEAVEIFTKLSGKHGVAYGMGRSYGDVCLNSHGALWCMAKLDRFMAFDETTGRLTCESGVLLGDIQRYFIPRGWMLPVTPGTQFVTVGGAIANDVHGKNHIQAGTFGMHVLAIKLLRTDLTLIECSPTVQSNWHAATIGGLGLTGLILSAEIQLRKVTSPWLQVETIPYRTLEDFFDLVDASTDWEYIVSWVDCLSNPIGRGIFSRAYHVDKHFQEPQIKSRTISFVPPFSLICPISIRLFNTAYFYKQRASTQFEHYKTFFYPLDKLQYWNRFYGPRGFFQHQSVIPQACRAIVKPMLNETAKLGGSFLSVLKIFGPRTSPGLLSFPRSGITLSLDLPHRGERTLALLERLDKMVLEAGGRNYLAKDATMSHPHFMTSYPHIPEFLTYRDPGISSELSRRLMGY